MRKLNLLWIRLRYEAFIFYLVIISSKNVKAQNIADLQSENDVL